uniref:Matrix protein VP40 n=1 Tax=Orthomarburgvirus marburgense TaxID=3052505 RepID=A0A077D0Z4_9MONO|nr:VP40 [Orthomarburgvirus marburgense]
MASSSNYNTYMQYLNPPPYADHGANQSIPADQPSNQQGITPHYVGDSNLDDQFKGNVCHAFTLEAIIDISAYNERTVKSVPAWLPLGIMSNFEYPLAHTVAALLTGSYTITQFTHNGQKFVRVNRLGTGIPAHPLRMLREGNQAFIQNMVIPRNFSTNQFTYNLTNLVLSVQKLPDDAWRPSKNKLIGNTMHPAVSVHPNLPPIVLPTVKKQAYRQHKNPNNGPLLAISGILHQLRVEKVPEKTSLFRISLPADMFSVKEGMMKKRGENSPVVYFQAPENFPLNGFNNRQVVLAYANPTLSAV